MQYHDFDTSRDMSGVILGVNNLIVSLNIAKGIYLPLSVLKACNTLRLLQSCEKAQVTIVWLSLLRMPRDIIPQLVNYTTSFPLILK
jgi:hypothetical protein